MLILSCLDLTQSTTAALIAAHATTEDRQASERFALPRRRLQRLAGRALLRAALSRQAGLSPADAWRVADGEDGRPEVVSRDGARRLCVSIAHSHARVVCAIADDGLLGVDIEHHRDRRNVQPMAAWSFGPGEQEVCTREASTAFYRIWALREAFAKAHGIGFPLVVDGVDRFAESPTAGAWQQTQDGESWVFAVKPLAGPYTLALALCGRHELVEVAATLEQLDAPSML